jgi:hypothetical protein
MHIRTHPSYLHDDRGQQQPRVVPGTRGREAKWA